MVGILVLSTDVGSATHTGPLFVRVATALFPWAPPAAIEAAHAVVRKLGHPTGYAVLGLLWFRALHAGQRRAPTSSAWIAVAVSVAWAVVDELVQATVPSRSGRALDVVIDGVGAALAAFVARARVVRRRRPDTPFR